MNIDLLHWKNEERVNLQQILRLLKHIEEIIFTFRNNDVILHLFY
jgi:hypothetical protein